MTTLDQIRALALTLHCPFCGAGPDVACRSRKTGQPAQTMHGRRDDPLWSAYRTGVRTGRDMAKESA